MSLKRSLRKLMLGVVAVVPALALANTQAKADVLADAILEIENFVLTDETGTVYTTEEITILAATNFANTGGEGLDSVAGNLSQGDSNNIDPPGDLDGDVKLTAISEGTPPAGLVDDSYMAVTAPPTTHYAYADSDVVGIAIDAGQPSVGVTAQTQASSGLLSTDIGDATSNTGLSSASFDFIAEADGELWISFDYVISILAFVSEDPAIQVASALATASWQIILADSETGAELGNLQPGAINQSRSRNAVSDGESSHSDSDNLFLFLGDLVSGEQYSLTITHQTFVDTLLEVPEPGTLLLFGGGLILLAFVGYRHGGQRRLAA